MGDPQMNPSKFYSHSIVAFIGAALALSSGSAVAQQPSETTLEEITVTARKRVENLQGLALSVSAMGAQEIQNNFATDLRDLVYISPNLLLDDTSQGPGGVAAAYIRGIGVSEVEKNFDPAVGVVVDGIFRGTMTGSIERAIDIARVEILRGPQGTLFGRNTIGGVINMERTKPTGENGGKIRAGFGNYETATLDGVFNFALSDTTALKLTASYKDQGEGYVTNNVTGRKDGQVEYRAFGFNPLFRPKEGLEIEFTYLQERTDQDTPTLLNIGQPGQVFCAGFGVCSPDGTTPISGGRYRSDQAYGDDVTWILGEDPNFNPPLSPYDTTYDADTIQLEVRWDLNDEYRFDYIYGNWETEETVMTDWDGVQEVMFHTDRPAEYEQDSHELRLTYGAGGDLSYTVGAYFWDSEYTIRLLSWIGFAAPNFILELPQTTFQTSESWAVFFEGDYVINDQWTLTLGGRYTVDDKTTDQRGGVNEVAATDWSEFTPKIALKYQIDDDSMVYGLFSAGYRAGGFNGRVDGVETATVPYDPETVGNFELGYKSEKLDGRMTFNVVAFYMDYKDKQEEIQQASATSGTGQVTRVVNAANATITGLEVDVMYLAESGIILRANLGLLDAKYDDFTVNTGTTDTPVITDFSHLDFRRAPKLTASLSAMYDWSMGSGTADIQAGWHYIDDHAVDFLNKPELNNDAQSMVNASFNYTVDNWRFSVFGHNLLDEDGYGIGFDVANLWSYAAARPPRTYGFEASYTW